MSVSHTLFKYPLHEAAKAGDFKKVQELHEKFNPNQMDDIGLLPLHYATLHWHRDMILFLLPSTNIKKLTAIGTQNKRVSLLLKTLLLKAVNADDLTLTKKLIEQGANLLVVDQDKFSVIQIALFKNNTDLALFLISAAEYLGVAKQLIRQVNIEGSTALHTTAHYLNYRVASTLLGLSPSISYFLLTHKNNAGETASKTIESRNDFPEPLKSVSQEQREVILRKYLHRTKKVYVKEVETKLTSRANLSYTDSGELDKNNKCTRASVKERPEIYRVLDRGTSARRQVLEIKRKALERVRTEREAFLREIAAELEKEAKEEDDAVESLLRNIEIEEKSKSPAEEKFPIPAPKAISDSRPTTPALIRLAHKVESESLVPAQESKSNVSAALEVKTMTALTLPQVTKANLLDSDFAPAGPLPTPKAFFLEIDDSAFTESKRSSARFFSPALNLVNEDFTKKEDSLHDKGLTLHMDSGDEIDHARDFLMLHL